MFRIVPQPNNSKPEFGALLPSLFIEHRDGVIRELSEIFFTYTYDNNHTLSPARLARFGEEEYHQFTRYLIDNNTERVSTHGQLRAADGLCIQAILKMIRYFVQFFLKHGAAAANSDASQQGVNIVFAYAEAYIEGFFSAQKTRIIHQQQEIRQALSTALTTQRVAMSPCVVVTPVTWPPAVLMPSTSHCWWISTPSLSAARA